MVVSVGVEAAAADVAGEVAAAEVIGDVTAAVGDDCETTVAIQYGQRESAINASKIHT